jgi:hypothetical protein
MLVSLDHTTHTYTDERGRLYKSVSSLISDYKQPFEPHKVMANGKTLIENYVYKNGGTVNSQLGAWDEKRDYACDRGHAFHSLKELAVISSSYYRANDQLLPVRNISYLWNIIGEGRFSMLPPGVYTEMLLWNYTARIAGTADLVIIYPDRTFSIKDYKTNGEFRTEAYQNRLMKPPFHNHYDCHMGYYTAQLSFYAWMLIQYGYRLRDLELLHYNLSPEDSGLIMELQLMPPSLQPTPYQVLFDQPAVEEVLEDRREFLSKLKYR